MSAYQRRTGSANVGQVIGHKLRAIYDEVAHEEVPKRFIDLLDELDAASAAQVKQDL